MHRPTAPLSRPRFALAVLVATTAATVALLALAAALARWGADDVVGATCLAVLVAIAVWGLAETAADRRHGRGEWADIDEWTELDNTLRGDR